MNSSDYLLPEDEIKRKIKFPHYMAKKKRARGQSIE